MAHALLACPTCELDVPEGLAFCPRCRATAQGRAFDPGEADAHERQYVLSLVALSLGALAIPRLLRSPAFTPRGKALVALLGLANTGAVVLVLVLVWRHLPAFVEAIRSQAR